MVKHFVSHNKNYHRFWCKWITFSGENASDVLQLLFKLCVIAPTTALLSMQLEDCLEYKEMLMLYIAFELCTILRSFHIWGRGDLVKNDDRKQG